MSGVYPTIRGTLLGWALSGSAPVDAVLKVCGVGTGYTYNAAHNDLTDLGANILFTSAELTGTVSSDGILDAVDEEITGVTPGPTLQGLVVFLEYTGGSALVCFIDSSTDASLPIVLVNTTFGIRWNELGICKI